MDPRLLIDRKIEEFIVQKLHQPPFIRLPCIHHKISHTSKLVKENGVALGYISQSLGSKSPLWSEVALLERILFLENVRLRTEPLLRGAKQVRKCMKVIKECNIFNKISACVESIIGLDGKMLLPSKQYLQYALSIIITIVRVAVQCIGYCRYTQVNVIRKLNLGHHLNISMVVGSIVSRIWVLCHTLIIELQKSYSCLYELHLSSTAVPDFEWLPSNVELPTKLTVELPSLELADQIRDFKLTGWTINEDESGDDSSDINLPDGTNIVFSSSVQLEEDLGVVLDRSAFNESQFVVKKEPAILMNSKLQPANTSKSSANATPNNREGQLTSKPNTLLKKESRKRLTNTITNQSEETPVKSAKKKKVKRKE